MGHWNGLEVWWHAGEGEKPSFYIIFCTIITSRCFQGYWNDVEPSFCCNVLPTVVSVIKCAVGRSASFRYYRGSGDDEHRRAVFALEIQSW